MLFLSIKSTNNERNVNYVVIYYVFINSWDLININVLCYNKINNLNKII